MRLVCRQNSWRLFVAAVVLAWTPRLAGVGAARPAQPHEAAACLTPELHGLAAEAQRALEEGYYDRAAHAARELVQEVEDRCGPVSPAMAEALDLLVRCLRYGPQAGDSASAEFAQRAVDLKRRLYGERDPRFALSLANQAALLQACGSTSLARRLFATALRTSEESLGPEHLQVAVILKELALLQDESGEYEEAIGSCERALQILEARTPLDSVLTSAVLNLLALDRLWISDYTGALSAIDRAIAIRTALYGEDHPRVQGIVNNRAAMLYKTGDLEAARASFAAILESLRRTLDDAADTRIGVALLNVGITTLPSDPRAARTYFTRAQTIFEERLGTNHEQVVKCLIELGVSDYLSGDLQAARTHFQLALKKQESAGVEHPLVANILYRLASVQYEQGDFAAARASCERALTIIDHRLGADSPDAAEVHVLLAAALAQTGAAEPAVSHSLQGERIGADHLRLMSRGFAEREALLYALERPRGLDLPLSLLAKKPDVAMARRVWDVVVRSRALVYDEMAARRRSTHLARDSEMARLYAELRRTSTRLAQVIVAGPGSDALAHARDLAAARAARESAEKSLAMRCSPLAEELVRERAGLTEVVQTLPKGWSLVAYVVYQETSPRLAPGVERYGFRAEAEISRVHAFVLGARGGIASVPIGPLTDVETLVASWSREIAGATGRSPGSNAAIAAYRRAGAALSAKIWDPVVPFLQAADRVLVVPDGVLCKVSFATLPIDEGKYLVDSGRRFHYLGAERDLLGTDDGNARAPLAPDKGLLVLGDIDFSAVPKPLAPEMPSASQHAANSRAPASDRRRAASTPCKSLVGVAFPPLPGTAHEIDHLTSLWERTHADPLAGKGGDARSLTVLRGVEATEATFKNQSAGYRFLHIATHGFFLGPDCDPSPGSTRGIHAVPLVPHANAQPTSALTLSGLVLAGANQRGAVAADQEDGILTAEEVAALDLQGLEWAVLSGCDTGVGTIQSGEGVLGLRRAFKIAGARTLIMSLWPVSDRATVDWMDALYTARLVDGAHTIDAVHDATERVLAARRQRGESVHPFYWSGFVATGDWR